MSETKKSLLEFAKKIKELREAKGYSQLELAYMCGLRGDAISQYESGRRRPNGKALSKLSRALDCSMEEIDGYKNEPLNTLCKPPKA